MAKDKIAGLDAEDVERAGLSDVEREALEADETGGEAETLAEVAGEGEKGAGDDDGEEGDDGKGEAKGKGGEEEGDEDEGEEEGEKEGAAAKGKGAGDGEEEEGENADKGKEGAAAAEGEADEEEDDDLPPPIPVYKAQPVEKYDEKMKALADADAEATRKFKASEIELDELLAARQKNEGERAALREAKLKADIAAEQAEQAQVQGWQYEVQTFMRRVKREEGIDYSGNGILNAAFDKAVKDLAAIKENENKSGRWFLREAHKKVMDAMGRAPGAKGKGKEGGEGNDAEDAAAKKAAAAKGRKPDLKVVPKTLGGKAAAGDDDAGGDPEFGHLDNLTGLELEAAVAAMTPAQQERWAKSR